MTQIRAPYRVVNGSDQFDPNQPRDEEGKWTIYRAGSNTESGLKPWASFTPEQETAKAYLDNPGFGGKTLRTIQAPNDRVLKVELRSRPALRKFAENIGLSREDADDWFDSGYQYPWEESKAVRQALTDSQYNWLQYEDDFPEGATTVVPIRQLEGAMDITQELAERESKEAENAKTYRVQNAKDWAKPFFARLLEPGLCSYKDTKNGIVLLRKETIDRCVHSFIGRPLVVKQGNEIRARLGRPEFIHQSTTPDNMKEIGHGYVTDVFYNSADGWWWCRGLADTDEAVAAISKVGKCSCGYKNTGPATPGGLWHDIPYNEEIVDFSGEHLAVVDSPRYEEATIRLNSKQPKENTMSMFKWIKKLASTTTGDDAAKAAAAQKAADDKAAAEAQTKLNAKNAEGAEDISGDTSFTVAGADGKPENVTLNQLIEAHNSKKNGTVDMDGDDEIMCNGKKYKINALVEAFDKWEKTNATMSDDDKKKENAKKEASDLAAAEAEKTRLKSLENATTGSKHFNVLAAARDTQPVEAAQHFNSKTEQLERGRQMFGSKKK